MTTFNDLGVPAPLVSALAARQITEAFPIQEAAIGDLLEGRDVLGRAPTGSGKTLAFGVPLLARVAKGTPSHPRALILAPTRELAEQISKELTPLAKATKRYVIAIYGGVGYDFQRKNLRRGSDVVVATPGRLTDLIDEGTVSLSDVDIVVIDEADRMADMGFMPQVKTLMDMTAENRQTVLFSATLDGDVADLTRRYQTDPVTHEVEGDDNASDAAHYFWRTDTHDRVNRTAEIIGTSTPSIVFTRTRRGADRVASQLERAGVAAAAIHGGRSQNQRTRALQQFSRGRVKALVATDVAARGIHVDGVNSVIHYDLPEDPKDYLHRSGRTARAGADGVVVSLVLPEQINEVNFIQQSVGLHTEIHHPADDWLTGESGGRIGETPIVEVRGGGGGRRRPQNKRGRNGGGSARNGGGSGRSQGRTAARGRSGGHTSGDRDGHGRRSDGREGPNENLYSEQAGSQGSGERASKGARANHNRNRSNSAGGSRQRSESNGYGGGSSNTRSNGNRSENSSDRDGNHRSSEGNEYDGNRSSTGNSTSRSNGYRGRNTSGTKGGGNGNRNSSGGSGNGNRSRTSSNGQSSGNRNGGGSSSQKGGYRGSNGGNSTRRSH